VILLDLGVPGMGGQEGAHRLRGLPALKDVLLVALTGFGREADRCRSLQAGFDGHSVKPAEPDALIPLLAHGNSCCVIGPSERVERPSDHPGMAAWEARSVCQRTRPTG
jgi:CheY-like chemotaxis protein